MKGNDTNALKGAKIIMDVSGKNRNASPPRRNSSKPSADGSRSPVKMLSRMMTAHDSFH